MLNDFFGEIISCYTDADAIADGVIINVSAFGVIFNGLPINRMTDGAAELLNLDKKDFSLIKADLQFIADNSAKDREDADAWGIFEPHERFDNEKLWLVANEVEGYSLMMPNEY